MRHPRLLRWCIKIYIIYCRYYEIMINYGHIWIIMKKYQHQTNASWIYRLISKKSRNHWSCGNMSNTRGQQQQQQQQQQHPMVCVDLHLQAKLCAQMSFYQSCYLGEAIRDPRVQGPGWLGQSSGLGGSPPWNVVCSMAKNFWPNVELKRSLVGTTGQGERWCLGDVVLELAGQWHRMWYVHRSCRYVLVWYHMISGHVYVDTSIHKLIDESSMCTVLSYCHSIKSIKAFT